MKNILLLGIIIGSTVCSANECPNIAGKYQNEHGGIITIEQNDKPVGTELNIIVPDTFAYEYDQALIELGRKRPADGKKYHLDEDDGVPLKIKVSCDEKGFKSVVGGNMTLLQFNAGAVEVYFGLFPFLNNIAGTALGKSKALYVRLKTMVRINTLETGQLEVTTEKRVRLKSAGIPLRDLTDEVLIEDEPNTRELWTRVQD